MTAIVAGSFDPITIGHVDLIERACRLFDSVVVLVAVNSGKKYHFSRGTRAEAIRACFKGNKKIKVEEWNGLTADYVASIGGGVIVRGARCGSEYDGEKDLYDINSVLGVDETIILPAKNEHRFISSTFVRELMKYGKDISDYIPAPALAVLKKEM